MRARDPRNPGEALPAPISLRNLQVLRAVHEAGSIRGAARRLYLSESAVSQQVRAMEQHFGAQLFYREGRRLAPTEAGRIAFQTAAFVLRQLDDSALIIRDLSEARAGRIEIAGSLAVGSYLLPRFLVAFHHEVPGVHVIQHVLLAEEMFQRLVAGDCAFGVTPRHDDIPGPLVERHLRHEPVAVVAAATYPLDTLTRDHLRSEPFVAAPSTSRGRSSFDHLMREAGIPTRRVVFESEHPEGQKEAAIAGLGLLATFRFVVERELRTGLLKEVPVDGVALSWPIVLVHRPHKHFSPAEARLISFLEDR